MTSKNTSTCRKSLSGRKKHKHVLKYGKPGDAIVALKNYQEQLPRFYFGGMRNKLNEPVELYFNILEYELHIKFNHNYYNKHIIHINTIERVFFEPIFGFEDYYTMCLQLDKSRHSRFWIYWVPAQYRQAIENLINEEFF